MAQDACVKSPNIHAPLAPRPRSLRRGFLLRDASLVANFFVGCIILGGVVVSAITAKEMRVRRTPPPALLQRELIASNVAARAPSDPPPVQPVNAVSQPEPTTIARATLPMSNAPANSLPLALVESSTDFVGPPAPVQVVPDANLRWFHGRSVRPAKVLWMTVTAYSPDWRSCGDSADNRTATMHCVTTNSHLLVAADPQVLPYGSILSVPGYGLPLSHPLGKPMPAGHKTTFQRGLEHLTEEPLVPVLDCGGAIKGFRLDLLYPTHEEALVWGVRFLPVTVWEYADRQPKPNPRRLR